MITIRQLLAADIAPTQARMFVDPLNAACEAWGINTPARIAAFVAQAAHESREFTKLEESLWYRDATRAATRIFRGAFDTNDDRKISEREIAFAQEFMGKPERLANLVYAGRNGNGNEASGDGWRFRGRGLFQLTGRGNYTEAAAATGRPYVAQPGLVAEPLDACFSAAWFWHRHRLNALADEWRIDAITRQINGPAMLKAEERRELSEIGARAFA